MNTAGRCGDAYIFDGRKFSASLVNGQNDSFWIERHIICLYDFLYSSYTRNHFSPTLFSVLMQTICYLILGAGCLGMQFWELIIRKHFDKTLLKNFRKTKLAFQMLCNEIVLIGPVLCCPIAVSCLLWCALRNLFGKSVSIVIYAHCFLSDKHVYFTQLCAYVFMHIFRIHEHLAVSIQCFLMQYFKMHIKIGGWKLMWPQKMRKVG